MKKIATVLTVFFISSFFVNQTAFSSDVGEFNYRYMGMMRQINAQRMINQRRMMAYKRNPLRNIRYPDSYNRYPNITNSRAPRRQLTARERYSPNYYRYNY